MSKPDQIKFENIDVETQEGQLLLVACALISGETDTKNIEEILIHLEEVHGRLCFEKELKEIIEDDSIDNINEIQ